MSSIFRVSRTETEGQQSGPATLNKAQEPVKMRVYDSYEDIDTTELADGEIVSTKETAAADGEIVSTKETAAADGSNVYDYVKKQIANAQSYSTEEQLTGGKWIDGKPIYRKAGIYNNGETIGTGEVLLDSTLTLSYVDTVIATGGSATVYNNILNIGGYSGDQHRLCLAVSNNGLTKMTSDNTYTKFKWWIEYTKTTD